MKAARCGAGTGVDTTEAGERAGRAAEAGAGANAEEEGDGEERRREEEELQKKVIIGAIMQSRLCLLSAKKIVSASRLFFLSFLLHVFTTTHQ